MASTAIVWFRRDLRLHDHPSLVRAVAEHDRVVAAFVMDPALLGGRFPSGARTAFLLDSLAALDAGLRERGAALTVRTGRPAQILPRLARQVAATHVYWASDVSPYARTRDRAVTDVLAAVGARAVPMPGNFAADVSKPRTKTGKPFVVFTPFWRAWEQLDRRQVHDAPDAVATPAGLDAGTLPSLASLGLTAEVGDGAPAGEAAARAAMTDWLAGPITGYDTGHDHLAGASSGLSPYLHFGLLSVRELEERTMALAGKGPAAFRRQVAWRDFYAHVLLIHPGNAGEEFQPRYRVLEWDDDGELLAAWCEGRTGYPVVDAGMRQLRRTGFMHNRARMIVGSFLTKDLHIDWRAGEAHFMRYLLDGDEAQNNGNWQWIASVGVDPAPYFRRIFNPVLQQEKFDPEGEYVRRWVPELAGVPGRRLAEPWLMTAEEQTAAGCVIGRDYPEPIVDHKRERLRAIERYRAAAAGGADG